MMLKHFPAPGPSPMSPGRGGELTDGLASAPDIPQERNSEADGLGELPGAPIPEENVILGVSRTTPRGSPH